MIHYSWNRSVDWDSWADTAIVAMRRKDWLSLSARFSAELFPHNALLNHAATVESSRALSTPLQNSMALRGIGKRP